MMRATKWLTAVLVACGLTLAGSGKTSAAAIDFSSVTVDFTNNAWSLGFEFQTNIGYTVTHLGFYDDLMNDLTESHDVGIYDSLGTLLVSGTVVPGSTLDGFFRYVAVTPTFLAAGQSYRIAATTGTENYTWGPVGFTTDPAITFVDDYFTLSATLVFPESSDSEGVVGWFGPNFDGEPVPEPGTLLLLGSGLTGLALRRRRRSS